MSDTPSAAFERFITIIKQLRDPVTGCPWDIKQTHETLKKYLIEETYEVLDAIDNSPHTLCEELGDLLLQIGLHAQIAADAGTFSIVEILTAISDKLVERHPHVFGADAQNSSIKTAAEVVNQWEKIKQQGKAPESGVLTGIPRHLPALMRAQKISKRAAQCGFEWDTLVGIRDKVLEEVAEFAHEATSSSIDPEALQSEFGDILFSLIQLARRLGFDAEEALQSTNDRFKRRFERMESQAEKTLEELNLDEWGMLWDEAKQFVKENVV